MGPECVCANDPFTDEIKDVEEYLIDEGYNIEELLRNAEEMVGRMKNQKSEVRNQKSVTRNERKKLSD